MDSYDYSAALDEVVPVVAHRKVEAGGFWVLRPDSGDPVEVVLMVRQQGIYTFMLCLRVVFVVRRGRQIAACNRRYVTQVPCAATVL